MSKYEVSMYKRLVYEYFKGHEYEVECAGYAIITFADPAQDPAQDVGIPFYFPNPTPGSGHVRRLSDVQCKKVLKVIYGTCDLADLAQQILLLELTTG